MTVIEIAKRAGVSIGTVDRVLHNRGRVSEETRRRVSAIISEEGYQPNPLARHLKRNRDYLIGVLVPELEKESRYWDLIHEGIRKAVAELSAFSFSLELFTFVRPDRESLANAFARMRAANCSAYIIAPVMQEETLALLWGEEKKVPYAFIDSFLPGADPLVTVAQDPFKGGQVAGRLMDLLAPAPASYAVIRPYSEAFNLNERARGFREWFAGRSGVRLLDLVCSELHMDEVHSLVERAIRDNPDLKGIFAVSAIGHKIADYLHDKGLKSGIAFIGYDLVDDNVRCLRDGRIDCLISQRPEEQGRLVMQQIYRKIVLEEATTSLIDMPIDIYFKENLL
jgi:LacI family transcriptional regulator